MVNYAILAEPKTFAARPGRTIRYPYPLNQGDVIDLVIDWAPWLGSNTVSSAAWDAGTGITVSGTTVTSTTTPATFTAGSSTVGWVDVEVVMTDSGSQKRSVLIQVEIVNLKT